MLTQNQKELLKVTGYAKPAEYFPEYIYEAALLRGLSAPDSESDIAPDPELVRILDNYQTASQDDSSATRRWQGLIEFQSLCARHNIPWQEVLEKLDSLFQSSGITPSGPADIETALSLFL